MMLSRMVKVWIQGVCPTYAILRAPVYMKPLDGGISPNIAFISVLLPELTFPMMKVKREWPIVQEMLLNIDCVSFVQLNVASDS